MGEEHKVTGELYFFNGDTYAPIPPITEVTTINSEDIPDDYILKPEKFTCSIVIHFSNNWRRMHGFRAVRRRRKVKSHDDNR